MSQKIKTSVEIDGSLTASQIANATTDTDKFLVSDGGTVKYRTGAELASDLGIASGSTSKVQHQVKAGVAINKGQAVYVTSADGTNMIVGLASNASEATSSKTMGLLNATVVANGFADVVTEGLLDGLDTSTATVGNPVWLGTGGNLIYGLANKPYAPNHLVFIGIVTRVNANNGEIFVKVQNGFELDEIHDVDLKTTTKVNGHLLGYNGSLWVNKTVAEWLGYTPYNASNPAGYISSYTETDTLQTVTDRGSVTTNPITINSTSLQHLTLNNRFNLIGSENFHISNNAYYSSGFKYKFAGNASKIALNSDNSFVFQTALTGTPDAAVTFENKFWADSAGNALSTGSMRSPIFYDYNDTSYYVDPSSTSVLSSVVLRGASAISFYGAGNGTYNIGSIYSSTSINSWEAPLETDSYTAARVPFILTWRGGYAAKGGLKLTGDASGELGGNVILHAGNYSSYAVPTSRTITINGTSYDLSANRSWTVTASETDTLQTVTSRGNTTTTSITANSIIIPSFETATNVLSFRSGIPDGTNVGIRAKATVTANRDGLELLGYNGIDFSINNGNTVAGKFNNYGQFLVNAASSGYGSSLYGYNLGTRGNTSQSYISVALSNQTLDTQGLIIGIDTGYARFHVRDSKPISFANGDVERMTLDTSANLTVNGSVRAPIIYDSSDTGYYWNPATDSSHRFQTPYGYIDIGPKNTSYCHIYTDRGSFYFNAQLDVLGNRVLNAGNYSNYAWPLEGGWKPASLASSTRLRGATSPDGGEFALAYSGGQIHPYADGFFYQNEGAYRVMDSNSIGDYTVGNYRTIADYSSDSTWYMRPNGRFVFANAHDWTQTFELLLPSGGSNNNTWAHFGQRQSNTTNGNFTGVSIRRYISGSSNLGDLQAGNMYGRIFYDDDNTAYYLDPASTSNLNGLTVANTITGSVSGSSGSVGGVSASQIVYGSGSSKISSHANANEWRNSGFYENDGGGSNWPSGTWYNSINVRHSNQGNYHGFQVAMSYYDNNLWFRSYQGAGTFQSWQKAAVSRGEGSNYVDYSRYVYNNGAYSGSGWVEPSDLGVRYALNSTNAGNADTVDGYHGNTFYRNLGFGSGYPSWDLNTVDPDRSGFTYGNGGPYTGPFIHIGASGYGLQFNASYTGNGYGLAFRTRNGDNGTWNSWRYPAIYGVNANGGGELFATRYYDQNDTAYYCDPSDMTNLKFLQVGRPSNGQSGARLLGGQGTSYGAITLDVDISNYGTGIKINNQSSTYANSAMAFFYNGSQCGGVSIGVNSTAYNTSSDYRLKENVVPIESPIVRLKELNPCRFNFINEPSKTVDGFIAHEVQEIIPEAVTGTKDELDYDGTPKHQGIDQSKIVPLLTAALQEAIAKIEELENRLSILENK